MKKSSSSKARRGGLSEKTKKIILVTTGCAGLAVGSWWAYMTFTTVAPPKLETAAPQQVVSFLGEARGYARMPIEAREKYLVDTYNRFAEGPARQELGKAFEQMTTREKQVFVDASFEVFKERFLERATEYNRLPPNKKGQFVTQMIQTFEGQRQSLAGVGGSDNMGEAFKSMVPSSTDGMTKILVSKTNTRQRAKAQPLLDDISVRYKEMQDRKSR